MNDTPRRLRIKVDRDACQTAATCLQYQLAADRLMYELDDDSLAIIKTRDGHDSNQPGQPPLADQDGWVDLADVAGYDSAQPEKMLEIALESAQNCPFNAIVVEENGRIIWPSEL